MLYKLLTCIFVLFSVSGCDSRSNPPKYEIIYNGESKQSQQSKQNQGDYTNEYTIAVVPKVSGIPYFNAVKDGALEAGRDLGVNVLYMGPTIADWEHQAKIIEELVQRKVNVIAVSANDPNKLGSV
ncbi:substrate-binding domain-containing protein [Ectobacillus funiculus]